MPKARPHRRACGRTFVQVIEGVVADEAAVHAAVERWQRDVAPGADGWIGGTYGVADDGTFIGVVRFATERQARANDARPEQRSRWREFEALFAGPVVIRGCSDVTLLLGGEPNHAGFVQVIEGRVHDPARLRSVVARSAPLLSRLRPDVLGATLAIDAHGRFTETVAFTTQAEARAAESLQPPPEARRLIDAELALMDDIRYLDLPRPWFASHR